MALINSAESQGFGFLFVSVPETDQHKKQKSGELKGDQANQNATNHRASSRYPSPHQSRFETSAREKDLQPSSTYVTGRRRMPTPLRSLVAARRPPRRALNVRLLAGRYPRP